MNMNSVTLDYHENLGDWFEWCSRNCGEINKNWDYATKWPQGKYTFSFRDEKLATVFKLKFM